MTDPREQYQQRQTARRQQAGRHERREGLAGLCRVTTFLSLPAVVYAMLRYGQFLPWWLLASLVAFTISVAWHRRTVRGLQRARRAAAHYGTALDRLDDRWPGIGPTGERHAKAEHPYALDLDLFGRGSLFQHLCAARTHAGQQTLAAWLLGSASPEVVSPDILRARQAAIAELRDDLGLREELAVLEAPPQTEAAPHALRQWLEAPVILADRVRPALAVVLMVAAVAALVGWTALGADARPLLAVVVLEGALLLSLKRQIRAATGQLDAVLAELALLVPVLRILERQEFASPCLREIGARLRTGRQRPSRHVARLARLVEWWDTASRNQVVAPMAFLLAVHVQLIYALERWRTSHAGPVADWLAAVGEFEALISLARHAYEHPAHPFPTITEQGPVLDAADLGHPLIPAGRRVTNDVCLGGGRQLLLVSGSNMSGKSTLLRTVGVNAVLALAGAPVCASRLTISPLAIASAMRSTDSLQEGVSAFYAELRRLRAVSDLAAAGLPVLFLLDEILHGTNSHDRRLGAEAVIDDLLAHGAIGLITTHDLALADIAHRLTPRATNVHFEDQLTDGRLSFDYRLRDGVVPRGNGLVLMRLLGFSV